MLFQQQRAVARDFGEKRDCNARWELIGESDLIYSAKSTYLIEHSEVAAIYWFSMKRPSHQRPRVVEQSQMFQDLDYRDWPCMKRMISC